MTKVTIDRELLEQAISTSIHEVPERIKARSEIRAILAAPRQPEGDWGWLVNLELAEVQCNCPWNPDSHDPSCPVYLRDRLSDGQRAIAELTDRNTKLCATINRMVAEGVLICDERDTLRQQLAERDAEIERLNANIGRLSSNPADHRYWEGRYRDEAAQRDKLAGLLRAAYEQGRYRRLSDDELAQIKAALAEVK